MPSEQAMVALRIALSFAAALAIAEAAELEFTFIAAMCAATLAATPGIGLGTPVLVPGLAWLLITLVGFAVFAFAKTAPLAFLLLVFAALWAGFELSRSPRTAIVGLLLLLFASIAPMRLFAYPEAAEIAVNDIARNVLVGALVVAAVGMVLPPPVAPANPRPNLVPVDPAIAAAALTLFAFVVWVTEPPAPGAVLVGAIIALRADASPGRTVARDRLVSAALGGFAAVIAATVTTLGPGLPIVFLTVLALSWPFALAIAEGGASRGIGIKSINALAILTAEGMSPLFEDTEERLGIRIAGVLIGLGFALVVLWLFGTEKRQGADGREAERA